MTLSLTKPIGNYGQWATQKGKGLKGNLVQMPLS
jgi:hypothetical protein